MLLEIANVLTGEEVGRFRARLDGARWVDGSKTPGNTPKVRHSELVSADSPEARQLGQQLADALARNQLFASAALPKHLFPPLFNRYGEGMNLGSHVDGAFLTHPATGVRLRNDISCTLFLSEPRDYDGGELLIEDTYGVQRVKLEAGSMVLYPSSSLHRVEPITRGTRLASFFWVQSLVREDAQRSVLFDLDMAIVRLTQECKDDPALASLTGVYNNLLRMWGDA